MNDDPFKRPETRSRELKPAQATIDGDPSAALLRQSAAAAVEQGTPSEPSLPGEVSAIASRYTILGLLGSGGMGNVYKVLDTELDEVVALKTLHASLRDNELALKRFRREVKLARRVTHPNVARTYDLGTDTHTPYLTMEFVEGETLHAAMRCRTQQGEAPFQALEALELAVEIARGLKAAHAAGVVHRDLKPANIMLTRERRVVVTDFGIARGGAQVSESITALDGLIGTPHYMSPEQVEGRSTIDHRADLYALGVMLYEALSGQPPFEGEGPVALALARLLHPAPSLERLGVAPPIAKVVATLLEREASSRYQSASELLEALAPLACALRERAPLPTAPTPIAISHRALTASQRERAALERDATMTRVAVFPLTTSEGTEEAAYLAEGFSEELVGELSMAKGLRVKPLSAIKARLLDRSSSSEPLRLGEELDVDVVVTGKVRAQGERLRIRLALLSVREGFQIWGEKLTCSPAELFVAAERAAESLAAALTSPVEEPERRPEPLTDPVAVDAYMKGRYALQMAWFDGVDEAEQRFATALQRVPEHPTLLTAMATTMARQVFFAPQRASSLLLQAKTYARRGEELAPRWPEPHYALAMIAFAEADFGATITHCQRALELSPDHIEAHDLLGRVLAEIGPLEEARFHLERALKLNDTLHRSAWDLVRVYALLGRWDKLDATFEKTRGATVAHNANEAFLFRLHCWRGRDPGEFEANFIEEESDPRFGFMAETARALIAHGRLSPPQLQALQSKAQAIAPGSQQLLIHLQLIAEFALISEELEVAYLTLEWALDEGLRDLMWLQHNALFEPIRHEQRFKALLGRAHETLSPARASLTPHPH